LRGADDPLGSVSAVNWEALNAREWAGAPLNLNPGALGTPSRAVRDAMAAFHDRFAGRPLAATEAGREAMHGCRARLAALHPGVVIALGRGATDQVATLLSAILRAHGGRRLSIAVTTEEHEGVLATLRRAPEVALRTLPPSPTAPIADLCVQSLVTFAGGDVLPLPAGNAWLLVDAAQAAGLIPFSPVGDLGVASLHKWMAGPAGTGFCWFTEPMLDRLAPFSPAGHPVDPGAPAGGFEPSGVQDFATWAGLDAALALHQEVGPARAAARVRSLSGRLADRLHVALAPLAPTFRSADGWTPEPAVTAAGFVVARFPAELDLYPLYRRILEREVQLKALIGGGRNDLRLGAHWGEREDRVDDAADRIAAVVAEGAW
jgi:hypothetical protein